jgi:ABC-2 type transport system permease protein
VSDDLTPDPGTPDPDEFDPSEAPTTSMPNPTDEQRAAAQRRAQQRGRRKPTPAMATAGGNTSAWALRSEEAGPYPLPEVEPIPAGWRVIGGREFAEHLLSIRFTLLVALMGLVGVFMVYTLSSNIRDLAGQIADRYTSPIGEPFPVFLFLFSSPPVSGNTALAAIPSFATLVIQYIGPLLGVAFGFDAISNERSEGTLPRLVSQPIHRDDVINGKFVASLSVVALILGAIMLILAGIGIYRLGVVPSGDAAARLFTWWVLLVLYVGFWLALATLFSVVFRRAATALLAVLAVWLVITFFGGQLAGIVANFLAPVGANATTAAQVNNVNAQLALLRLFPSGQFAEMTAVMLNPSVTALDYVAPDPTGRAIPTLLPVVQSLLLVWPQIVTLIALTAACFAGAYVTFMRQEVRA